MAESVTWHLWPKLTPRRGKQAMDIYVSWNGDPVTIPKPEDRPPLHGFAQAFQALLDDDAPDATLGLRLDEIRCGRPKADVGVLATVPLIHRERVHGRRRLGPRRRRGAASRRPRSPASATTSHSCGPRNSSSTTSKGPPPPEGGTEWAGVFRARDEQDDHFAAAEPPTHDSWNPELLPKSSGRTIVNVGLREIKAALENRWAPRKKPAHVDVASTALVADELAHLVGAIDGRGKGRRRKEPVPSKPGAARPKVDFTFSAPIELADGLGTLARLQRESRPGLEGDHPPIQRGSGPRRILGRREPGPAPVLRRGARRGRARRGRRQDRSADPRQHRTVRGGAGRQAAGPRRPSCSMWKPSPSGEAPDRPVPHPALGRQSATGSGCCKSINGDVPLPEGGAALGLPDRPRAGGAGVGRPQSRD